ncbi:MAG: FtsX-like permease family protein [SAR202 cluster bacterium]|nr:FtsX-like permease family protein [SAR202 cluster bacterium]|tara:strand:- start:52701 stop:53954 length:1254 start_codon:yes stop_codon:yes gene_type:complete
MIYLEIIKVAFISLSANKLRSILALLGIVIGVTAVISLMAIGKGTQERITSRIQELGTNLLFIKAGATTIGGFTGQAGSSSSLTFKDAKALKDPLFAPSVIEVAPEITIRSQLVFGRKNTNVTIMGVTPQHLSVRNLEIDSGMFISSPHIETYSEVIVLGSQVSEDLFGFQDPIGEHIRVNGKRFYVIGVLKSQGGSAWTSNDGRAFIPLTTAFFRMQKQKVSGGNINVETINVQTKDLEVLDDAINEVSTILRLRHQIGNDDEDDFNITSQEQTIETLRETTNTFVVFLGAIAGISLIVGGIGIMNIMLVSVTERTKEIGIRKAMGAKKKDILFQFISEATVLSFGGGFLGVVLGYLVSNGLNGQAILGQESFQTVFSLEVAILSLAVSAAIGLFFGIYPAARAAKLHPIEALRFD